MSTHETYVGGVRTFWSESDRPTLAASLMFRQGQVDETLATSGWTHLIEHLALHGRESVGLDVNGSVDLVLTSFDFHGEPDDVSRQLTELSAWLSRPDLTRMQHESRVLAAEARQRSGGPVREALVWRYGAAGPGLCGFDEPGLSRVTVDSLLDTASNVFTTGNAVLCLDGPVPTGLSIELPAGDLRRLPEPVPCDGALPRNAGYVAAGPWCCASGIVERTAAASMFESILRRRTEHRFREELGISYAPFSLYERLTKDVALVVTAPDLTDADPGIAARAMLEVTDALGTAGPSELEVADHIQRTVRDMADPRAAAAWSWVQGRARLMGEDPLDLDALRDQVLAVEVDDVRDVAEQFLASRMLGAPHEARHTGPALTWITQPSAPPLDDAAYYRSVDFPLVADRISLGAPGVQHEWSQGRREFRYSDLAALLAYPDGGRMLVRRDAYQFVIEPTMWRNGAEIVASIDAIVPADLVLPQPPRAPEDIPRRTTTWWRQNWHWVRYFGWRAGGIVALVAATVVVVANGYPGAALIGVAAIGAFAAGWMSD